MIVNLKNALMSALLLIMGSGRPINAQGYNPLNPPDPNSYYKVIVVAEPANSAFVSGTGSYTLGSTVTISSSSQDWNYQFVNWTLNGEFYTVEQSFEYVVIPMQASFVAHYKYEPVLPEDPNMNYANRLYLKSVPEGCCSFNRNSGDKIGVDTWVDLDVWANQGYEFKGWYADGKLICSDPSFFYLMPDNASVIEARFVFNPSNPDDPELGGGNIDNGLLGDIDEDRVVDITDAVILNGHYINATTDRLNQKVADVNCDSEIDVSDVVEIIQKYLR